VNRRESWVRSILLFAVGFVATSKLIDRILPYDLDPLLHAKMTHFQRHKDEYTTLFIGDSRIYRELVPTQFDAALRSAGVESESFNLALLAMSIPEAHFLLERVAALRPKRLKYVIVGSPPVRSALGAPLGETSIGARWRKRGGSSPLISPASNRAARPRSR